MNDNENKLLIITGASRGIGRATAQQFRDQGYSVINLSRTKCDVIGVENISVDLLQKGWMRICKPKLLLRTNQVDQVVLIHNAALLKKDNTSEIVVDSLRRVLELNVVAAAELNALLIPEMKSGSAILYVSSTLGTKAVANSCSYVISKHAVIGQMRATCQDLAGTGIHTACVCPGFTDTEMLVEHIGDPSVIESLAQGVTMKRLVKPDEIADTLWFCGNNPVINGAVIHANLGQIES